jgi:hypothetical protein
MNGDLKTTFMQKAVREYMESVREGMRRAGARLKVNDTGDALATISYAAAISGPADVSASLSFKEYLRFVDMGVGKGRPLGGLKEVRQTLQASNNVGVVLKSTRKPKKVYSKVAYGNLTWLENKLLYGLTEETIAALKAELEQKTTTANV